MKANQAFRTRDEAVSPVIAVILMVAITVVLAATVYVWVSGFGAQSGTPAKTIALSSAGALASGTKTYAVASATSGMKWNDVNQTLDGTTLTYDSALGSDNTYCVVQNGTVCIGTYAWNVGTTYQGAVVGAGQQIQLHHTSLSGKTLRILDAQANSVILTLTVG